MSWRVLPLLLSSLLLTGCPYVGDSDFELIRDADGDGEWSVRFGGGDCRDNDPSVTLCDADGDGRLSVEVGGDDCDDTRADVHPQADEVCDQRDNDCDGRVDAQDDDLLGGTIYYPDGDGDDYGDPDQPAAHCGQVPPGWTDLAHASDCNDADPAINITAEERCDTIDHDCDGDPNAGAIDQQAPRYLDSDSDGFGAGADLGLGCLDRDHVVTSGDCNDADANVWPGAPDVPYDGLDSACDGDDGEWDVDGDGFEARAPDNDCDDTNDALYPGAPERCDGVDDDCDGLVDDDDPDLILDLLATTYYLDADGDFFGGNPVMACVKPSGTTSNGGDCDDGLASVFPGATESCDGVDNDCDGVIDGPLAIGTSTYYLDGDGDGFGAASLSVQACAPGTGRVANDADCNDADATIFPGAPEVCGDGIAQDCGADPWDCDRDGVLDTAGGGADCDDADPAVLPGATELCDGIDNDCNGLIDSADPGVDPLSYTDYFLDSDGDGFGSLVPVAQSVCDPPPNTAANDTDCDDSKATIYPGAPERCNGVDDDCDTLVDQGVITDPPTFYFDSDGDGYGVQAQASTLGCDPPDARWVASPGDCDDSDTTIHPAAPEVCDGRDDDCDGLGGDDDPDQQGLTWYRDDDADGYGQDGDILLQCAQPAGYVLIGTDCDDTDDTIQVTRNWYADVDQDGFGDPNSPTAACVAPAGAVLNDLDCDDTDPSRSPQASERCSGVDDDCDGLTDDADPSVNGQSTWFADVDADGWGANANQLRACALPSGYVPGGGDCNDADPNVFVGAPEACDGLDNDCDNLVDEADPDYAGNTSWYDDLDGDGHGDPTTAVTTCTAPSGSVALGDDCDDTDPGANPGITIEACDGVDNDCDGLIDYRDLDTPVVDDGQGSCDRPPFTWAGADQTVLDGATVPLIGLANDEDPSTLAVAWTQLLGTPVSLSGADTLSASFTAPSVTATEVLVFSLTATDAGGLSTSDLVTIDVVPINQPPIVYAGPDAVVVPGTLVSLAGVATDSDGVVIASTWSRLSGPLISFDDPSALDPSFTAPSSTTTEVLLLQLEATDDLGARGTDTVIITVDPGNPGNQAPVASAGADDVVFSGDSATLQGTATDADGWVSSTLWTQIGGPTVSLTNANTLQPSFSAPLVLANTPLVFQLVVLDNQGSAGLDQVVITVQPPQGNLPPAISAGQPFTVRMGAPVSLNGSASDLDGSVVSVAWTQISGASVSLSGANTLTPSFTAPSNTAWACGHRLRFQLAATDDQGAVSLDEVAVLILTAPAGVGDPVASPYTADFEADDGGLWTTQALWEWGTPSGPGPGQAASGARLWATLLGGDVSNGSAYYDTSLCLPPVLLPAGSQGSFAMRLYARHGTYYSDWVGTRLRYLDPIQGWITLDGVPAYDEKGWANVGTSNAYQDVMVRLPPEAASAPVVLRLHFMTARNTTQVGAYVDDIIVTAESQDTDADGVPGVFDELNLHGTSPWQADSDGDGFTDGVELGAGSSPSTDLDYPSVFAWQEGDGTDLELDDGGLVADDPAWQHGTPTVPITSAWSGTKVWATYLNSLYPAYANHDVSLRLPVFDLTQATDPVFSFRLFMASTPSEGLAVERWDDVTGWTPITPAFPVQDGAWADGTPVIQRYGEEQTWGLVAVDLSPYVGRHQLLRLHFLSVYGWTPPGAYIDDLALDSEGDDIDADGITGVILEHFGGTDPMVFDTDGDGYSDGIELATVPTCPTDYPSAPVWSVPTYEPLTDNDGGLIAGQQRVWEAGRVLSGPAAGHSGDWAWATGLDKNHPTVSNDHLYLPPLTLVDSAGTPASRPSISFWINMAFGGYAGANLERWDGSSWVLVAPTRGAARLRNDGLGRLSWASNTNGAWTYAGADLSAFAGQTVLLRMSIHTLWAGQGLLLDDILLSDEDIDYDADGLFGALDEWEAYGTDPANPDTDGDGVMDGDEVAAGTDPLDPASY